MFSFKYPQKKKSKAFKFADLGSHGIGPSLVLYNVSVRHHVGNKHLP